MFIRVSCVHLLKNNAVRVRDRSSMRGTRVRESVVCVAHVCMRERVCMFILVKCVHLLEDNAV